MLSRVQWSPRNEGERPIMRTSSSNTIINAIIQKNTAASPRGSLDTPKDEPSSFKNSPSHRSVNDKKEESKKEERKKEESKKEDVPPLTKDSKGSVPKLNLHKDEQKPESEADKPLKSPAEKDKEKKDEIAHQLHATAMISPRSREAREKERLELKEKEKLQKEKDKHQKEKDKKDKREKEEERKTKTSLDSLISPRVEKEKKKDKDKDKREKKDKEKDKKAEKKPMTKEEIASMLHSQVTVKSVHESERKKEEEKEKEKKEKEKEEADMPPVSPRRQALKVDTAAAASAVSKPLTKDEMYEVMHSPRGGTATKKK